MLRIADRYLAQELAASLLATNAILLLVMVGGLLTDVLNKVARGKVSGELLLSQVLLRSVEALPLLLPLALFLGVMMGLSRLYRDGEMAILSGAGLGRRGLLRPLLLVALPVTVILALLSLWLAPMAARLSDQMLEEAARTVVVAGLEPGRFVELPGRDAVLYVERMSGDGVGLGRLFLQAERRGRLDIVSAESGRLELVDDRERYLILHNGQRVEGSPGDSDFRLMRFASNSMRLADVEEESNRPDPRRAVASTDLRLSEALEDQAEWHGRWAAPISALLLALLAVPLARSAPREGRYGKLLLGLVIYLLYSNALALGRLWLGEGRIPEPFGLWWLHAALALLALLLFWRDGRRLQRSGRSP